MSRQNVSKKSRRDPESLEDPSGEKCCKASDQGFAPGQFLMAQCLTTGAGTPRDLDRAQHLLRAVAEQGYIPAEFALGFSLKALFGGSSPASGADQDAGHWLRKAADDGYGPAQTTLGMEHLSRDSPKDQAEASAWFRKAAEHGFAQAAEFLGQQYERGGGVTQDYAEAAKWYRRALEGGQRSAGQRLGLLYARGLGVSKDPAAARMWVEVTLSQTDAGPMGTTMRKLADFMLDTAGDKTNPEQNAAAKQQALAWIAAHPEPKASQIDVSMWVSDDGR